jgi:hypothetical protein
LSEEKEILLGDMVLAACAITYLGPFEVSYRTILVEGHWEKQLRENESIPTGLLCMAGGLGQHRFDLRQTVGDVEQMQAWELQGIPNDSVSYENMIILEATEAKTWPVVIDPQE